MDKVLCSPYLLSRFNSYNPLKSDNCRSFSDKVVCFGTKHNHFSCSSVSSLQKDNNVSWLRHLCPQITKIKPWNHLNRRNQSWWHGHLFHWGEILGRCSCPFLQRARSVRVERGYRVSCPQVIIALVRETDFQERDSKRRCVTFPWERWKLWLFLWRDKSCKKNLQPSTSSKVCFTPIRCTYTSLPPGGMARNYYFVSTWIHKSMQFVMSGSISFLPT